MDTLKLSFFLALADQENGIKKGYQRSTGLWFPHDSVEGGTQTIAYGHKLTPSEQDSRVFENGITDQEAVELMVTDYNRALKSAELQWNRYQPINFYEIQEKYQLLLGELVFNIGSMTTNNRWQWPKLAMAIRLDNDSEVRNQSIRYYYKPSGEKVALTIRSDAICRSLGIIF